MDFFFDPSLVLYLPLYELDGASFMSKDKHGHLCTVTGALWRPYGRYFDGSDDKIACGSSSAILPDAFTVIAWVKPTTDDSQALVRFSTTNAPAFILEYAGNGKPLLIMAGDNYQYFVAAAWNKLKDGSYHQVAISIPGAAQTDVLLSRMFVDDEEIAQANSIVTGTQLAKAQLDIGYTNNWGKLHGLTGEFALFNRVLAPVEIQHYYLATKWRYR